MPLAPGGGVFPEDDSIKSFGDFLLCSIVVICSLNMDVRGGIHQVLLCGKCVQKWDKTFWSGR